MSDFKTKISLKTKLILLIVPIIVLVMLIAGYCSYRSLTDVTRTLYMSRSQELSETAAKLVDPHQAKAVRDQVMAIYRKTPEKERVSTDDWGSEAFYAYLDRYRGIADSKAYRDVQKQLQIVQDSNHLNAAYMVCFDLETNSTIYLVDAAYEDTNLPGSFDAVMYDVDREAMKHPENGLAPDVTNTKEYGWVVAAGSPVFCDGELIGFAAAEISMNEVMDQRNQFLMIEFVALLIVAIILIVISLIVIDKMLIRPINKLSDMSEKYWSGETSTIRHEFSQLEIHTGDELEMLSNSMKQMEQNINEHITKILNTTNELIETRQHAEEMDRAANIDALTKVRNKRAYDIEMTRLDQGIAEGKTKFGIAMIDLNFLKTINDTYGHDKGDIAIQTLCQTICHIFVHSPVYRVGGDEFVVVLENHDLENLDELKAAFDREIEKFRDKKEPWERVSAAAGYALYDPAVDKDAESVFKRADALMYEQKKRMKARRD